MLEDGVWRTIAGRRVFIKEGQSLTEAMKNSGKFEKNNLQARLKKQFNKKEYMWHGTSEENIEKIKDNGFREDRTAYFATNQETAMKNYGNNVIMLEQNQFKIKNISADVKENGMPTNSMRELAKKQGYDGVKYKTSKQNSDIEIFNINKLNKVLEKTEIENLELSKQLGGELTKAEENRLKRFKNK